MSTELKLAELVSYLKDEFPGFTVTCLDNGECETVLQLRSSDQIHIVRVQEAFLERTPTNDIRVMLADFRTAQTLRDLGDFPIVVTINGCIFA